MALSNWIRKIGRDYPWSVPPNAVLLGLVTFALLCCMALTFSMWYIRWLQSHVKMVVSKHQTPTHASPVKPERSELVPPVGPHRSLLYMGMLPSYILANPFSPCIKQNLQCHMPLPMLLYWEEMLCQEERSREQTRLGLVLQIITQSIIIRKLCPRWESPLQWSIVQAQTWNDRGVDVNPNKDFIQKKYGIL